MPLCGPLSIRTAPLPRGAAHAKRDRSRSPGRLPSCVGRRDCNTSEPCFFCRDLVAATNISAGFEIFDETRQVVRCAKLADEIAHVLFFAFDEIRWRAIRH